ncbi:MAG TPA: hypothetical protein VEQ10_21505, partial [Vicinamibacteria bacterium]|nr:hypothetical protein [Vicinamibacteria bacterium]
PRALFDGLVAVGYPWIADEVGGVRSALGVLATLVNAQANVLLLAWWTAIALRHRGLDPVLEEDRRPALSRLWASLAVAFVVVSAVPFLAHAVRDGGGDKWFQR